MVVGVQLGEDGQDGIQRQVMGGGARAAGWRGGASRDACDRLQQVRPLDAAVAIDKRVSSKARLAEQVEEAFQSGLLPVGCRGGGARRGGQRGPAPGRPRRFRQKHGRRKRAHLKEEGGPQVHVGQQGGVRSARQGGRISRRGGREGSPRVISQQGGQGGVAPKGPPPGIQGAAQQAYAQGAEAGARFGGCAPGRGRGGRPRQGDGKGQHLHQGGHPVPVGGGGGRRGGRGGGGVGRGEGVATRGSERVRRRRPRRRGHQRARGGRLGGGHGGSGSSDWCVVGVAIAIAAGLGGRRAWGGRRVDHRPDPRRRRARGRGGRVTTTIRFAGSRRWGRRIHGHRRGRQVGQGGEDGADQGVQRVPRRRGERAAAHPRAAVAAAVAGGGMLSDAEGGLEGVDDVVVGQGGGGAGRGGAGAQEL